MKTEWDYSERAANYDKRADYSEEALSELIKKLKLSETQRVADIGAGTGKLTKKLLDFGLVVDAIEPNDSMRFLGQKNTVGRNVNWIEAVAENTGLQRAEYHGVFFGSSFNVVDQTSTLKEVARLLVSNGWFACLWNHRDLKDPVQKNIEKIICRYIPNYQYGSRREDPSEIIVRSGLFGKIDKIEKKFIMPMKKPDIVAAWKSHETLSRQAGEKFDQIIEEISYNLTLEKYNVPYYTRIWFSRLKN
ncbi:MAG: class I SAM-dependent methyltransferase [Pseudomonadota bacterium]|nr:class I SAM-dependent methyltransferase [Pseudomonadota bacterium]